MGIMLFILLYLISLLCKIDFLLRMLPTSSRFLISMGELLLTTKDPKQIEFLLSGFHLWA